MRYVRGPLREELMVQQSTYVPFGCLVKIVKHCQALKLSRKLFVLFFFRQKRHVTLLFTNCFCLNCEILCCHFCCLAE